MAALDKLIEDNVFDATVQTQLRESVRNLTAAATQRATQAAQQAQQATARLLTTRIDVLSKGLAEQFPKLSDQAQLDQVLARMNRYVPAQQWSDLDDAGLTDLIKEAAWAQFGDAVVHQTRQQMLTGARRTAKGQPETPAAPTTHGGLTADQRDDALLDAAAAAGSDSAKFDKLRQKIG